MVEIVDRESAVAWAADATRQARIALAARSALRTLPMIFTDAAELDRVGLAVLRAVLTAVSASTSAYAPDLQLASSSAALALEGATASDASLATAIEASRFAAQVAFGMGPLKLGPKQTLMALPQDLAAKAIEASSRRLGCKPEEIWKEASSDATVLYGKGVDEVYKQPLWRNPACGSGSPTHATPQVTDSSVSLYVSSSGRRLDFWERWYEGMFAGRPLDWGLQREVAVIAKDDWEKGPEHIARLIAEIEARYLADTLAERIALAPSGRLTLVPQPFPTDRHLGLLIDTVRDALDLATSGTRNELPEDAYQVRLLRRTFALYGNDPQRIEMDFERARVSLIEDIAADAIPASAPNRDLVQALSDAAGAIRDNDAEIARNRERLNRIRLGQVSPEDATRIAEVAELVAEISEGVLRDDLLEDRFRLPGVRRDAGVPDPVVPVGIAERNAALEAQAAQLRLYSRLAKVWLFLKAHDREIALVGSLATIIQVVVNVVR